MHVTHDSSIHENTFSLPLSFINMMFTSLIMPWFIERSAKHKVAGWY